MDSADILIVKNNLVSDTSFSNIAFFDGNNWFTPSLPLLKGTKRELLIYNGLLNVIDIKVTDIKKNFKSFCLINSMINLSDFVLPIENIHF